MKTTIVNVNSFFHNPAGMAQNIKGENLMPTGKAFLMPTWRNKKTLVSNAELFYLI
jgi:hypothetical protein